MMSASYDHLMSVMSIVEDESMVELGDDRDGLEFN